MAERPKRSRKKLFIWLGIVVALVIAVVPLTASNKREKPILITTDKAFVTNITEMVTATGKIQPENEVKIAPEVSGEIIEIAVKEGQAVQRGRLLRIKPDSVSRAGRIGTGGAERIALGERREPRGARQGCIGLGAHRQAVSERTRLGVGAQPREGGVRQREGGVRRRGVEHRAGGRIAAADQRSAVEDRDLRP
jgi:hypothetical protein